MQEGRKVLILAPLAAGLKGQHEAPSRPSPPAPGPCLRGRGIERAVVELPETSSFARTTPATNNRGP